MVNVEDEPGMDFLTSDEKVNVPPRNCCMSTPKHTHMKLQRDQQTRASLGGLPLHAYALRRASVSQPDVVTRYVYACMWQLGWAAHSKPKPKVNPSKLASIESNPTA